MSIRSEQNVWPLGASFLLFSHIRHDVDGRHQLPLLNVEHSGGDLPFEIALNETYNSRYQRIPKAQNLSNSTLDYTSYQNRNITVYYTTQRTILDSPNLIVCGQSTQCVLCTMLTMLDFVYL